MDPIMIEGLAEVLLSTVLFGSAYVPLKRCNYGDGIFSLQMRCISIMIFGFLTFAWTGFTHFYPLAMIGGVIWTCANMIVLPCISELGLGVACLLYNFTNCLTNWATGNFGLFWTNARKAENPVLNYIGLVGLLFGGSLITFIRPEKIPHKKLTVSTITSIESIECPMKPIELTLESEQNDRKFNFRRLIAIFGTLFCGFLFGQDPTPVIIVQDRFEGAPKHGIYYVFSFYMGIVLSSSVVFIIYCFIKKGRPYVNSDLVLPSILSGVLWAIGQGLLLVCMGHLSIAIAGPIASIIPGCIASLWSVFYFKEIKGRRNLAMLCASIIATSFGTILISLSK